MAEKTIFPLVKAFSLNRRPRQRFGFRCPIEVLTEVMQQEMALSDNGSASIH